MKLNDWLRWGVIIGVLAIFFTPLVRIDLLFFPFITGKGFVFRILVEIVFALWLILAMRDPSVRPRMPAKGGRAWLFVALTVFVAFVGFADIFSMNPTKSFWSNFERMDGWISLIHLWAFFTVVWATLRERFHWRLLFETTIAVSVVEALWGMLQLAGKVAINQGGVRVDGTFGNAAYLAIYMLFSFFFTALAFFWWGRKTKYIQWWYALAAILQLIMIFYTATRGAILGLAGGVFVAAFILLLLGKTDARLKKGAIGLLVFLVVVMGGLYAARHTPLIQNNPIFSRVTNIAPSDLTTRFTLWHMAFEGVVSSPKTIVVGWGQESFNYIFNQYYEPSLWGQEQWFDRAHNEFIDWFVAAGLPGFLLYLSLFALLLWYVWRSGSSFSVVERGLITGLIVAYALNNMVVFDNLLSYILFFTLLAYVLYRADEEPVATEKVADKPGASLWTKPMSDGAVAFAAPVTIAVMAGVFYFANVPGMLTAYELIDALKPHPQGIAANVAAIKSAENTTGLGRQEVREQTIEFALQVKSSNIGDAAFQTSIEQYAALQMQDELSKVPNDARLHVFFGSFFQQLGQNDAAFAELVKAQALSPRKQQILFELGSIEMGRGNAAQSLAWFKQAYDLDHSFGQAAVYYAAALIRTGNPAAADAILEANFQTTTPDNDTLLQAYLDVHNYARVIALVKARADADPKNLKLRVQVAAAYLQSGDRASAIQTLQDAIAMDPSFAAQGQYYIQQIQKGATP